MKTSFLFFVFLLSFCSQSYSQDTSNSEVDLLLEKAQGFYKINQDSALYYSEIAYNKAKALNDPAIIGKTIAQMSIYLISKIKYDKAEALLNLNLQNKTKISQKDLGITYSNLGAINSLKEHRDDAILNYLSAIDIFDQLAEHNLLARNYLNIGVIYENEEKLEQADYFFDKSLYHSNLAKNSTGSAPHENVVRGATEDFEIKLRISFEALKTIDNPDQSRLASVIYHDLSKTYIENSKYEKAIESAKKSLEIKSNIGYTQNSDYAYYNIGLSQVRLNQNDNGIDNLKKAIALSEKRSLIPLMYEAIILGYKNKQEFKKAFDYTEQLTKIKDSIATFHENERIAEITSKYQVEKQANYILKLERDNQESELLLAKQKSKRWQWATLSIVFLISSIFLGRQLSRHIKKVKKIEAEKLAIEKRTEFKYIVLNNKAKVYTDELDFIKSDGNYLEFHFGDKKTIDRNKLKEIAHELPPNFVQVHRSFIINKNSIQSLNATSVRLKTGMEIPLSRTFKHNLF